MAISDNYNSLTFGGVNSLDYGIFISGPGVYNAPTRAVEFVDVPGRNGAIEIDQGHWNNIEVTYTCGTFATDQAEFGEKMNDFRNAIVSQTGYQRLTDTYNPEHYRLGLYANGIEVEPVRHNDAAEFTLVFNCKPQRYLVSGDTPVSVASGSTITNPTLYETRPTLAVFGHGSVIINGEELTLSDEPYGDVLMRSASETTNDTPATITMPLENVELLNTGDTIGANGRIKITIALYSPYTFSWTGSWSMSSFYTPPWTNGLTTIGGIQCPTATFNLDYQKGTPAMLNGYTRYSRTYNDGGPDVLEREIDITVSYDGKKTITVIAKGGFDTGEAPFETAIVSVSEIYGHSTASVLGNPSYVDFDTGEVWKTIIEPGEIRGEVFMRNPSEERKDIAFDDPSAPKRALFPLTLANVDQLETADAIGSPNPIEIRVALSSGYTFSWTGNWRRTSTASVPWVDGLTTISGEQCPTATFELRYEKGTPESIDGYGTWQRTFNDGEPDSLVRNGHIIVEYDGDETITVTFEAQVGSGEVPFPTAITSVSSITGFSTTPIGEPTTKVILINDIATMPSDLVTLKPGDNTISYSSTVTNLQVIPKWWEL